MRATVVFDLCRLAAGCRRAAPPRTSAPGRLVGAAKPRYSLVIWNPCRAGSWAWRRTSGGRLARLEVDGTVLTCTTIARKLAVPGHELLVGLLGTVGGIGLRVDEGAPDQQAAVRAQRIGHRRRAFGVRAAVVMWPGLAFGAGLDEEATEVRDQAVDPHRPWPATRAHGRVGGVRVGEASQPLGDEKRTDRKTFWP